MARTRNIKPDFFKNEDLCELAPLARLLFAGLWTLADRKGVLEDRPKKIKVEILPYDDCDVDNLLQKLHDAGFIKRYTANGSRAIHVVNFHKHQNPHPKEPTGDLPQPEGALATETEKKSRVIKRHETDGQIPAVEIPWPETDAPAEGNGNSASDPALPSFPSSNPSTHTLTTEIAAPPLPAYAPQEVPPEERSEDSAPVPANVIGINSGIKTSVPAPRAEQNPEGEELFTPPYVPVSDAPFPPTVREVRRTLGAADLNGRTSGRFSELWDKWPRKKNRDAAAMAYMSVVMVENEAACFACAGRYLASDEVSRNVVQYLDKWILECHRDNWECDWPPAVARMPPAASIPPPSTISRYREND